MEILKVIEVSDVKQDVNGMPYKTVKFSTSDKKMINSVEGRIIVQIPTKVSSRNFQGHSYLELSQLAKDLGYLTKDGKADYSKLSEEEIKDVKPEFGYNLKKDQIVVGAIVSKEVEEYEITDSTTGEVRTVNTYSRVILGDSGQASFHSDIVKEFRRQGHELIQIADLEIEQGVGEEEEIETPAKVF